MGSGYSMLFAKHLACGGLPFGLEIYPDGSGGRTMILLVDGPIRQAIRNGKHLAFTEDTESTSPAMLTLFRMPSSTFTDIYYELDEKEDVGSMGVITVGSK
jgi:hypothetical protein